jgi:hypothetical protein
LQLARARQGDAFLVEEEEEGAAGRQAGWKAGRQRPSEEDDHVHAAARPTPSLLPSHHKLWCSGEGGIQPQSKTNLTVDGRGLGRSEFERSLGRKLGQGRRQEG